MSIQISKTSLALGRIPGAGIDAGRARRPGVPMEHLPMRPAGNAHWSVPERQADPGNVLKRRGLEELTPVFGTAVPPRGLSGWMRRMAYQVPEHHTSHWFVLLLADRVDALESNPLRALPYALALLAGVGAVVWRARRSSTA